MVKQFFMIWLITSIFGYGMVWAVDGHVDELDTHHSSDQNADLLSAVSTINDNDDHPACDHCCHAAAHLIALRGYQSENVYSNSRNKYSPYRHSFLFLSVSPPVRPPRA